MYFHDLLLPSHLYRQLLLIKFRFSILYDRYKHVIKLIVLRSPHLNIMHTINVRMPLYIDVHLLPTTR
jgi:hypothetical protein